MRKILIASLLALSAIGPVQADPQGVYSGIAISRELRGWVGQQQNFGLAQQRENHRENMDQQNMYLRADSQVFNQNFRSTQQSQAYELRKEQLRMQRDNAYNAYRRQWGQQ